MPSRYLLIEWSECPQDADVKLRVDSSAKGIMEWMVAMGIPDAAISGGPGSDLRFGGDPVATD